MRNKLTMTLISCFLLFHRGIGIAQDESDIGKKVVEVQQALEELRGKKFKHDVKYANQSREDFSLYLERNLSQQFPDELRKHYDKVARALGLYSGPKIEDFGELFKQVMQSQAAAYYDPAANTFFVVMQGLDSQMLDAVYAHELYHGFQDQYFNLKEFVLKPAAEKTLNDDQLLARQAVVEGEATYLMTLSTLKSILGRVPPPARLRMAIQIQASMGVAQMLEMVKQGNFPQVQGQDMQNAINSMAEIPAFVLESMIGAYLKGMAFVYEIQQQGWNKVEELYANPPLSTEQILHPEKWLQNERPVQYVWPSFDDNCLIGWHLIDSNTLGELYWRVIFCEQKLESIATKTAAGWNGDSYAVFQDDEGRATLLLLLTNWDSITEATEFEGAYKKLLANKYPDSSTKVTLERSDAEVLIIEGATAEAHKNLLNFLKRVRREM